MALKTPVEEPPKGNTLTKDQIKEFKKAEKDSEDFLDVARLAQDIVQAGDKEWAGKVYKKAEGKAEDTSDFRILADSIYENLEDKEWVGKVYKKAEGKAEDYQDFSSLTQSIQFYLGDKEWLGKVYKKMEDKAEGSTDFRLLADSIDIHLEDKEWAGKVYKKMEDKEAEEKPADDLFKLQQVKEKQDSKYHMISISCCVVGGWLLFTTISEDMRAGLIILGIALLGLGVLIWPRDPKN